MAPRPASLLFGSFVQTDPHPSSDSSLPVVQDSSRRVFTLPENPSQWLDENYASFNSMATIEVVTEEQEVDLQLERILAGLSMQEDSLRVSTAASQEAVEALEKVTIRAAERETSCTVCLEEFSLGSEALMMPCSHLFHGDCIIRWLEGQRLCPLCRFELPLAEEKLILEDLESVMFLSEATRELAVWMFSD